jgi:hypothetical protein
MFGRDWSFGAATIVTRTESGMKREHGWMGPATFHYVADIRPEDGSAGFSARFDQHNQGPRYHYPEVGEQVRVKFDGKHKNVQIDVLPQLTRDLAELDPELAELMRLEEAERLGLLDQGPGGYDPDMAELMRLEADEMRALAAEGGLSAAEQAELMRLEEEGG